MSGIGLLDDKFHRILIYINKSIEAELQSANKMLDSYVTNISQLILDLVPFYTLAQPANQQMRQGSLLQIDITG